MPYVQRNEAGEVVGRYANRQPGYAEEWLGEDSAELAVVSQSQMVIAERSWRDGELLGVKWLRERHRDQLEIDVETTLTAEQFKELLVYMQALRDWPQSADFPDVQRRPAAPPWIVEQIE